MIDLRTDQMETVENLRATMLKHQSVLLRGPCGFGKTVVAAYMASGAQRKNRRAIFAVHRRELARQTALTFQKFGITFGYIIAGFPMNPMASVQIASVDTLRNRPGLLGCDLFIPDEAHLWSGPTRQDIIDKVRKNGSHIVPLTATPRFPNGRSLSRMADAIVNGPSEAWLIEHGFLAKYRAYAPSAPDLKGLHTKMGEYVVSELEDRFSRPAIYGDAVASYRKYASGRRMIGYCYSRRHGSEMAETFNASGIRSAFIDGESDDKTRRAAINGFADGDLDALFNAQLFREGFDLSAQVGRDVPIQAVGLYNPTQSLTLAVQMMMRGMRPQDGHTVILDHANVLHDHGFPDDEREWDLNSDEPEKRTGEKAIATVTCGQCFAIFRPQARCPYCGCERDIHGRQIAHVDGDLEEIDPDLVRLARRKEADAKANEMRAARTPADVARFAVKHGHNAGWVLHRVKHMERGNPGYTFPLAVKALTKAKQEAEVK